MTDQNDYYKGLLIGLNYAIAQQLERDPSTANLFLLKICKTIKSELENKGSSIKEDK